MGKWRQSKISFKSKPEERLAPVPCYLLSHSLTQELAACINDWNHVYDTIILFSNSCHSEPLNNYLSTFQPKSLLCDIAAMALEYSNLFPTPLKVLKSTDSVIFSRKQIACILANAFFCAFQNTPQDCNSISFSHLYTLGSQIIRIKLQCIMHYFKKCLTNFYDGDVKFSRISNNEFPQWKSLESTFIPCNIYEHGTIEDDGRGMLQLDFSNKYVGGGVLGRGLVQEEILFLIKPELIAMILISPVLQNNEIMIATGCKRYSLHSGYRNSFQWIGDYIDEDEDQEILLMDAHDFSSNFEMQYKTGYLARELNKAFLGFKPRKDSILGANCPIASGNWGCGVFNGDPTLKFILQWIVASYFNRTINYFTFGNSNLASEIRDLSFDILQENFSIGDIMQTLVTYCPGTGCIFNHIRQCSFCFNINDYLGTKSPYPHSLANSSMPFCEIKQIQMIIRHGTRFPTKSWILKFSQLSDYFSTRNVTFPFNNFINEFDLRDEGNLHPIGIRDIYNLSSRFSTRYRHLIRENQIFFQSSNKSRTIDSSFYFYKQLNLNAPFNLKIVNLNEDADLTPFKCCDMYSETISCLDSESTECSSNNEFKSVYFNEISERIFKVYHIRFSVDQITTLFEYCAFQISTQGEFKYLCSIFNQDDFNLYQISNDIYTYEANSYKYPITSHMMCSLFSEIGKQIELLISNDNRAKIINLKFGHAETIMPLLALLGLYNGIPVFADTPITKLESREWITSKFSQFASNIGFELLSCNNDWIIKIRVNENYVEIPGCPNDCKWELFKLIYSGELGCNYDSDCNNEYISTEGGWKEYGQRIVKIQAK